LYEGMTHCNNNKGRRRFPIHFIRVIKFPQDWKRHLPVVAGVILASVTIALSGCVSVGPDYVAPSPAVSPTWHTELKGGLAVTDERTADLAAWWTTLSDSKLSDLIERAVVANLDIRKAKSRMRQARASLKIAQASFFPTVDASGSAVRSRSSENLGPNSTGSATGSTGSAYSNLYRTGLDASWEIDIFGGVRRSVEAAHADAEAMEENLNDVLVSLLAEVASNYVDVRAFQARIAAVSANARSQNETYQITVWRNEAGISDELAVQQARYNLENTRSQIPALRTSLEGAMNRIGVLLGDQPGAVHAYLEEPGDIPLVPRSVAVGVPAEMVRRRPDIRKAERELAAETARVGVAVANLYPIFTLTGSIGLESISTGNLLAWGSRTLSVGPGVTLPIFHGGALRQKVEYQSAVQEAAAIAYEKTVLNALEEVENALVAYAEEQNKRDALIEAEDAARKAVLLAEYQYQAGLANFLTVLDAQRSLLAFQNQLAESKGAVVSNLIRVYKTLGGGWQSLSIDPKTESAKREKK
jgi:outer membrane protein, multidrug efflux system